MTDPTDQETSTVQPTPGPGVSEPPPAVVWTHASSASDTTASSGQHRVLDIVVWVVALAALVVISLVRAGLSGTTGAERFGYIVGGIAFSLLLSAAARWLWLRARRRNDPTARFLSPWIPIGAVILAALSLSGSRS